MFQAKKFHEEYTCSLDLLQGDHRQARARLISDMIKGKYKQPGKSVYVPNSIVQDMKSDYGKYQQKPISFIKSKFEPV